MTRPFLAGDDVDSGGGVNRCSVRGRQNAQACCGPVADLVPRGLGVLTWRYPLVAGGNKVITRAIVMTNVRDVSQVRGLINSLPVNTIDPKRICPTYESLPCTVSLCARLGAPALTRVVFELGDCPAAQVYQRGVKIEPTLGGAQLSSTYQRIQKMISPGGLSLGRGG